MPPKQSQVNAEKIDAILRLLEDGNVLPSQAVSDLRDARGIGRSNEVADNHTNG